MIKSMLIKWFMPSDTALAKMLAEAIRKGVNTATDSKEEVIAKYATTAKQITAVADQLADVMGDGKIDDGEEAMLADLLLPIATKIKGLIA